MLCVKNEIVRYHSNTCFFVVFFSFLLIFSVVEAFLWLLTIPVLTSSGTMTKRIVAYAAIEDSDKPEHTVLLEPLLCAIAIGVQILCV